MLRASQWQRKHGTNGGGGEGRGRGGGSNPATSIRRFFPNGNDRDVCPFGCVIRASLRSTRAPAVTGVAPANHRSDKSTGRRKEGIEQRRRSVRLPRPRCRPSGRTSSLQLLHCCLPQSNEQSGLRRSSPRAKGREGGGVRRRGPTRAVSLALEA